MKLSQLASKPQLIKITLDENEIIEQYGEAIEFWTWDRQPLDTFMRLAQSQDSNAGQMIDIVRTLILDENGQQVIDENNMLPTSILLRVIQRIVDLLGK